MVQSDSFQFSVAAEEPDAGAFAWSPDGTKIVVLARLLRYAIVYDAASGKPLARLNDLAGGGSSIGFAPDGRVLLPPHDAPGHAASLWDSATGQTEALPSPGGAPGDTSSNQLLDFSIDPASNRVVGIHNLPSGAGVLPRLALFDLAQRRLLAAGGGAVGHVAVAPGGKRAAIVSQSGQVDIVDLDSWRVLLHIDANENAVTRLAWSKDGAHIATGSVERSFGRNRKTGQHGPLLDTDLLQLWDAQTGRRIAVAPQIKGEVASMDTSSDGRWLAATDATGNVHLFDQKTLGDHEVLATEPQPMTVLVRFSPDGKRLARLRTRAAAVAIHRLDERR